MTVHIGPYGFDQVDYDKDGDVLYLRTGPEQPAVDTFATPEGHAVRLDERGELIGIPLVNANGSWSATADSESRRRARRTPIPSISLRR